MSAISTILQIGLLLAGSYLWMRYFSAPSRRSHAAPRFAMPAQAGILSGVGIVMMIVGLSGISSRMLAMLGFTSSADSPDSGSILFLRILLGSIFGGVTAGLSCLLMRILLTRKERTVYRTAHEEPEAKAQDLGLRAE